MMDSYGTTDTSLNSHQVEIYTANLFIHGNMLGPFTRTADLINRRDFDNFHVQDVSMASLGYSASPRQIGHPLIVARSHIHMVAVFATEENTSDPMLSGPLTSSSLTSSSLNSGSLTSPLTGGLSGRLTKPTFHEHRPMRVARPCFAFTSSFVISGLCHLMEGTTIEQLLDGQNIFFHLTQVTAYLTSQPNSPWRRDLVMINKNQIQAVYTGELSAQVDAPQS
jgi:hypothetical protein